ncbi:Aste57867_1394 [Aphanomyces stellatus]|uniref:Aste57867_1394 protein n=1 Tax=Aphanomyces stellatus TaxID=120398 RepID=A0A485K658_9STRA|nr:hypothetical protein As57867_001393 [Aphanomyces stellatus]VFT78611.1 Aste57867_1394 [Aphanomyces stellatus]
MQPTSAKDRDGGIYLYIEGDNDVSSSLTMRDSHLILKDSYDFQGTTILEEGALVPGGALSLWSGEAMAIFAQYAAIGFVYSMFPGLQYAVYNRYVNLDGYQLRSYTSLVNIGWSLKIFFGMLSDCIPILGYRRKPWILFGWLIALGGCLYMTITPFPAPYFQSNGNVTALDRWIARDLEHIPAKYFHKDAQDNAFKFILASLVSSIGYVMANCASDAMVVQYAQREPLATRGRLQTAIYTIRTVAGILSSLLIGIGFNGPSFGGSFEFELSVNVVYGLTCIPCALACVSTVFWLREAKSEKVPFAKWVRQFWGLLQKQVLWQILAFRFLSNMFQNFNTTANAPVASIWIKVEPIVETLSTSMGLLFFSAILTVVGKYGLQWNWRWTIALATVGLVAMDATLYMISIWDICRSQWFYTGATLAEQIPSGVRFIVAVFCAVEMADMGNEGAVYGLVTSVNNLTTPAAAVLYKYVDSYLHITNKDFKHDTTKLRWNVTYSFLISYGMKIGSLVWLFLLPPQKAHLQRLKRNGVTSSVAGAIAVALYVVALLFAVVTNLMSVFESTSCYRIAGGSGCDDAKSTAPKL